MQSQCPTIKCNLSVLNSSVIKTKCNLNVLKPKEKYKKMSKDEKEKGKKRRRGKRKRRRRRKWHSFMQRVPCQDIMTFGERKGINSPARLENVGMKKVS